MRVTVRLMLSALACTLALGGCRVESHKGDGGNEDVKVATPFGHMQVNTDKAQVQDSVGLNIYPGATPDNTEHGNNKSADINMSFGNFRLRVKAISYLTPDSVADVEAFYRKDLARYGTVIACDDQRAIGTPTRTPEGLTCNDDQDEHTHTHGGTGAHFELKTGSKQHQHLVGLTRDGERTKIGLVALDLPSGHFGNNDGESEKSAQ